MLKQIKLYTKQHHEELKTVTCRDLHQQVHVGYKGELHLCCPTWMPWVVGNINEQTIKEYLNSSDHQKIINSTNNGSFEFCDHSICPEIQSHLKTGTSKALVSKSEYVVDSRLMLLLDYDKSCNLQCPSC